MRKTTNIERALAAASTSPETQIREVDAVSSKVQKVSRWRVSGMDEHFESRQ
jgi:hypothetical protein